AVSDAQIEEYFEANAAQFFHPEAVKLEYLELDQASLAKATDAEEADLRRLYEEQRSAFSTPDKRYARHILIKTDSDADEDALAEKRREIEELRERITAGESFEAIAREFSQDPGSAKQGGDLGLVQRGVMVKPFEEAVFALQEGELSEPVKTTFGFHLIKLDRLEPGSVQSFEEVRDKILEQEQLRAAENVFFDRVDVIANEAYENSDSLASASEAAGIEVAQSDWIERSGGPGIGEHTAVRAAAFSQSVLEQRLNSDMIEIGNNHVVVIRVSEHRERRAKTLDEVRDDVVEAVVVKRARDAAEEAAQQALAALQDGTEADEVAARFSAILNAYEGVARGDTEPDATLRNALFRMPRPDGGTSSYVKLNDAEGDPAVLVMHKVHSAEAESEDPDVVQPPRRTPGSNEYNAWLEALKSAAEIERREELL
ncbi:MAG: peptidylprolyl isomerase, partial [Gammaproteobacteria bacterium]|nr:peptidylprolyl isomerase [Gammaproteobacteria bacterium]